MSKKSRKPVVRKPIPVATRAGRPQAVLPPDQRLVVDLARDLPQFTDAFDAEGLIGHALTEAAALNSSTPFGPLLPEMTMMFPNGLSPATQRDPSALTFDGSGEHQLWKNLIEHTHTVPSRRGLALLYALAAAVPDEQISRLATEHADALAGTGIPAPPWASAIKNPVFGDCWIYDDQSNTGFVHVVCSYEYEDNQHAIGIFIDHMMGGLAKNAVATTKIDQLIAQFPMKPITVTEAHNTIAKAYEITYEHPEIPVDPDVHRLRFLVHRRIKLQSMPIS